MDVHLGANGFFERVGGVAQALDDGVVLRGRDEVKVQWVFQDADAHLKRKCELVVLWQECLTAEEEVFLEGSHGAAAQAFESVVTGAHECDSKLLA